jgi:hypothetical protein
MVEKDTPDHTPEDLGAVSPPDQGLAEAPVAVAEATPAPATPLLEIATEPPSKVDLAVDGWFIRYFHDHGPDLPTHLYNHFTAAKDQLKADIRAALTQED